MTLLRTSGFGLTASVLAALLTTAIAAEAGCGLCARQVTINGALAECYLERFPDYEARQGTAIAIDLSDCPEQRGVVEALSSPAAATPDPDLRFILSREQLTCFTERLRNPATPLDPLATISLDDCE